MRTETVTIERIRNSYMEKEVTKLDELKELDKKVKRPATATAYTVGTAASLILGTGMCLAMKVIGAGLSFAMPLGIGVGLVGMFLAAVNYPMYKKILKNRKDKYSKQIFELSDSLLNK